MGAIRVFEEDFSSYATPSIGYSWFGYDNDYKFKYYDYTGLHEFGTGTGSGGTISGTASQVLYFDTNTGLVTSDDGFTRDSNDYQTIIGREYGSTYSGLTHTSAILNSNGIGFPAVLSLLDNGTQSVSVGVIDLQPIGQSFQAGISYDDAIITAAMTVNSNTAHLRYQGLTGGGELEIEDLIVKTAYFDNIYLNGGGTSGTSFDITMDDNGVHINQNGYTQSTYTLPKTSGSQSQILTMISDGVSEWSSIGHIPQWIKIPKSYQDFTTASLVGTFSIYTLPIGGIIQSVIINVGTAFAGPTISSYGIQIGKAGNVGQWIGSFSPQSMTSTGKTITNNSSLQLESFSATTSINAKITADDNLDTANAGDVDIYLLVSTLP